MSRNLLKFSKSALHFFASSRSTSYDHLDPKLLHGAMLCFVQSKQSESFNEAVYLNQFRRLTSPPLSKPQTLPISLEINQATRFMSVHITTPSVYVDDFVDDLADKLVVYHGSPENAPEEAKVNEQSMQTLLRFLDMVNPPMTEYPPAAVRKLEFYLKPTGNRELKKVELNLKTTGGYCPSIVEDGLKSFFKDCGLPTKFHWQKDAWILAEAVPIKTKPITPPLPTSSNSGPNPPSLSDLDPKFVSSNNIDSSTSMAWNRIPSEREKELLSHSNEDDSEAKLDLAVQQLEKALEAIASVPWHTEAADRRRIQEHLVCLLEEDGWRIQSACLLIWMGERDEAKLTAGLDAGSRKVVRKILAQTKKFADELGEMKVEMAPYHMLRRLRN